MPDSSEAKLRKDELARQLDDAIEEALFWARGNYRISLILMILAVCASITAGIGGLTDKFGAQLTGSLALVPGAIALLVSNIKFQDKSNWHYQRYYESAALKSRLLLQLPEIPTVDHIAGIAKERDEMEARLSKEWDDKFTLNFSAFDARKQQNTQPTT